MITREEIINIGIFNKAHGVKGEISATLDCELDAFRKFSCIVVDIDGIFVPFFIKSCRTKGNESLLLHFDGIDSEQEAATLSGLAIFVPKSEIDEERLSYGMDYFVGFDLYDTTKGRVGTIASVDDTTANVLFAVGDYLIPVSEDLIAEIDAEHRILYMSLPEGLLEL